MADKYITIQKPVEAMQHDGSIPRGHEILAWVFRNNGSGTINADDLLTVETGIVEIVDGNDWVICSPISGFSVMNDGIFRSTYTAAPTAPN